MTLERDPLVSVVTPVYNGEPYLRQCIESVLSQTYTNWDYTIVNNCSTDRTLEIAQEYASRHSRVRVRNNETFVPVIENHNRAFRQISAESKYCKVVAGDDWLFPECIEKMVRLAEEHPTVAIVGAYGLDGSNVLWTGMPYPSSVVPGREACRALLLGGPYIFGTPTTVLYKSQIVRNRHSFYNESNLHADAEVCLEFLEHCDFGFVHQVLTFTRVREESYTSYSKKLQTYLPNALYDLMMYGPKYLSERELKERTQIRLQAYYQYLGSQVYELRNREFWDFHRRSLAELGYRMSWWRVATGAVSRALELMLNPKRLFKAAVRRSRTPR
jgi:glycosyltransferase involved in cell wall biosynthesis